MPEKTHGEVAPASPAAARLRSLAVPIAAALLAILAILAGLQARTTWTWRSWPRPLLRGELLRLSR